MKTVNSLLITALLLVTTVMTWTYFAVRSEDTASYPQVGIGGGPETSDPNISMQALFSARTVLLVTHLTNVYDGTATDETEQKLENNTQRLGDTIKQFGTGADKQAMERILRGTIDEYESYTQGLKENKPDIMNRAKENLQMQTMDFGELIHKLQPTISEERATELYNDYNVAILEVIDAHPGDEKFAKANAIEKANAQALLLTDTISSSY